MTYRLFGKLVAAPTPEEPKATTAWCCRCDVWFDIKDLDTALESEGWEHPSYTIHLCPTCDEGGCVCEYA